MCAFLLFTMSDTGFCRESAIIPYRGFRAPPDRPKSVQSVRLQRHAIRIGQHNCSGLGRELHQEQNSQTNRNGGT